MHIAQFEFHRPRTLDEASSLVRELGDGAWLLAGGTDIVPDLKRRMHAASHLISLAAVEELRGIRQEDGDLFIGALTTHAEVAASADVRAVLPALCDAASTIGSHQVRSQATIGGNWCGGVPCADTPPASIVGHARAVIHDGNGGRELAAEEFITAPRETALAPGEILTAIRLPRRADHSGSSFQRFTLRKGIALAVASVAASVELDGEVVRHARVALGAVGPTPIFARHAIAALEGQPAEEAVFREAARAAAQDAKPITDIRGSADYRREIVEVLTRRALVEASQRARGNGEGR